MVGYKIVVETYSGNSEPGISIITPGIDYVGIAKYLQERIACDKMVITVIFNRKTNKRFVYKPVKGAKIDRIGTTYYTDTRLYDDVIGFIQAHNVPEKKRRESDSTGVIKRAVGKATEDKIIIVGQYSSLSGLVVRE